MSHKNGQTGIFDVAQRLCGLPELAPFVQYNKKVPETVANQTRLLRKWNARREALHRATRAAPEETASAQLSRVATLVDHAFATHPFYHRLYSAAGYRRGDIVTWDDYAALPTVTKRDIVEHHALFQQANLAPAQDDCYSFTTSGSSGQVLQMLFDRAAIDEDMLLCLRFYEQMLGRRRATDEWHYQIYLISPPFTSLDGAYPTFTVSNDCPLELVAEHLRRMRPAVLTGLPSYLERLGQLLREPGELGVSAIGTNSEASTPAERARIAELFGAPVFDEYSSVELALIATQCQFGNYHVVEDGVRVDVLDPDDEGKGEIVATNLFNTFMPLIRYRQGDGIGLQQGSAACGCGSRFRMLSTFSGRTDQFLRSRRLGKVPPDRVMSLYDRTLLERASNVGAFQIVQRTLDQLCVFLVPRDSERSFDERMLGEFCTGLKVLFGDPALEVTLTPCSQLPHETSYKRRLIKCEVAG